jgi:hypothetical protein
MIKYKRVYLEHFDLTINDFFPCEITGQRAVDIHHIEAKGMGGSKKSDEIENLMAVTRDVHLYFGDKTQYKEWLKEVHEAFMEYQIPWVEWNPDCEILNQYLNDKGINR